MSTLSPKLETFNRQLQIDTKPSLAIRFNPATLFTQTAPAQYNLNPLFLRFNNNKRVSCVPSERPYSLSLPGRWAFMALFTQVDWAFLT